MLPDLQFCFLFSTRILAAAATDSRQGTCSNRPPKLIGDQERTKEVHAVLYSIMKRPVYVYDINSIYYYIWDRGVSFHHDHSTCGAGTRGVLTSYTGIPAARPIVKCTSVRTRRHHTHTRPTRAKTTKKRNLWREISQTQDNTPHNNKREKHNVIYWSWGTHSFICGRCRVCGFWHKNEDLFLTFLLK